MLLSELFDDSTTMEMSERLRQAALDLLVPMAGQKVPFVTVQQVIDELHGMNTGLTIDRSVIMDILEPETTKVVKSIEGDKINLQLPQPDQRKTGEDQKEKEREKIRSTAQKQAKKEIGR